MLAILIFRPEGHHGRPRARLAGVVPARAFTGLTESVRVDGPWAPRLSLPLIACALRSPPRSAAGDSGSKEADDGPIVIGTANSLTGTLAPFEKAINVGMEIAADEINAAGASGDARSRSSTSTRSPTSTCRRPRRSR